MQKLYLNPSFDSLLSKKSKYNQRFLLHLVTDTNICGGTDALLKTIELAAQEGVSIVQLREKFISNDQFIELGLQVKKLLQKYNIPLIINDRIDVALAINADGVHLGQKDTPYQTARKILGYNKIIGISINTIDQAVIANSWDVSYLGVGAIFNTSTKNDVSHVWNLDELKTLRKSSKHILVGIGGINKQNAKAVLNAGLDGIAVVSAICGSSDPSSTTKELLTICKTNQNHSVSNN